MSFWLVFLVLFDSTLIWLVSTSMVYLNNKKLGSTSPWVVPILDTHMKHWHTCLAEKWLHSSFPFTSDNTKPTKNSCKVANFKHNFICSLPVNNALIITLLHRSTFAALPRADTPSKITHEAQPKTNLRRCFCSTAMHSGLVTFGGILLKWTNGRASISTIFIHYKICSVLRDP